MLDDVYRMAKQAAAQGRNITISATYIVSLVDMLNRAEALDKERLQCQICELKTQIQKLKDSE
jgi:hypothetical protein